MALDAICESPSVPHNGPAEYGMRLRPGMVGTVEPMINAGSADCHLTADGGPWLQTTINSQLPI